MTEEMTIKEMNASIAKFMEVEKYSGRYYIGDRKFKELQYHSSWDWLMPVVGKIESLQTEKDGHFGVYISSNNCTIEGTKFKPELRDEVYHFYIYSISKIHATWLAVHAFIQWYNENKQP